LIVIEAISELVGILVLLLILVDAVFAFGESLVPTLTCIGVPAQWDVYVELELW
jgi:hypothetical protein